MNILIDIGHPAHIHLFRNFAGQMLQKGDKVLFTCRDREHVHYLLSYYGFEYVSFGRHFKTIYGKMYSMLSYLFRMLIVSLKFRPDIYLSHGSTCAAQTSFLMRKPHVAFEDTFNKEQLRFSMPFTDIVLTGDYPHPSLGSKEIKYPGYHQLAYLHPQLFNPDYSVLNSLGIKPGQKYAIVRFVAFGASHDIGQRGISLDDKRKLVSLLSKHMKVFISSESELPEDLKQYQIRIKPEQMHNVLYHAHMFIGESGSMAVECAVLGTPNVVINSLAPHMSVFKELVNRYRLQHIFSHIADAWDIIEKIVSDFDYKSGLIKNKDRMLQDKINVTDFLVWFIENYPASVQEVRTKDFSFVRFR